MIEENRHIIYLGAHPTTRLINSSHGNIDSLYRDSNAIIAGLKANNADLHVVTSPDVSSFPKGKLYLGGFYDSIDDAYSVSSLNLPIIKQIWTIISMFINVRKIIKVNTNTIVIIPYMVYRHVMVGRLLQLFYPKATRICIVVPDIYFPKSFIHKLYYKSAEKMAKKFDSFVLYTNAMASYLGIENKPYIIIEGFHEIKPLPINTPDDKFVLTYAGILTKRYGLERLLDSLKFIDLPDFELHLYGFGDGVDLIKEREFGDSRIKYYGRVSKEVATRALYESSALINPRNAYDGEYVQYSFPSKDIDYLSSGIPSILCKLPGMPVSYYPYFFDADDGSPQKIAETVLKIYAMSINERLVFGVKAQAFISEQMNVANQGKRIVELINK